MVYCVTYNNTSLPFFFSFLLETLSFFQKLTIALLLFLAGVLLELKWADESQRRTIMSPWRFRYLHNRDNDKNGLIFANELLVVF